MGGNLALDRHLPTIKGRPAYEHFHRYAFSQKFAEGKRVLDMGCGAGLGSAILANRAAYVVGFDSDAAIVAIARRNYTHRQNCMFMTGDVSKLPFADGEFDAVVSFETLQDVHGREAMIAELARVLNKDGHLIISMRSNLLDPACGELVSVLNRHFAASHVLGQRFFLASAIGAAQDGQAAHATYDALTRDSANPLEVSMATAKLVEPEHRLFLCSKVADGLAPIAPSLYFDPQDDLWREQLAINGVAEHLKVQEEDLRKRNRELETSLAAATQDAELHSSEAETLRQLLDLNKRRLGLLEEEGRTLSVTMAEVIQRSGQLSNFIVTLHGEIAADRSNRQHFMTQSSEELALRRQAEADLTSLRGELGARERVMELTEQHHERELSRLSRRVELAEAELAKKNAETAEMERSQRDRLDLREREIGEIKGKLNEATAKVQELSQRLSVSDDEIEQLKTKLADISEIEAALRASLVKQDEELAGATSKFEAAQQQILETAEQSGQSQKWDEVSERIVRIEKVLASHLEAGAKLESSVENLEHQLEADKSRRMKFEEDADGRLGQLQRKVEGPATKVARPNSAPEARMAEFQSSNSEPVSTELAGFNVHSDAADHAENEALRRQLKEAQSRLFERTLHVAEFNRKFAEQNLANPALPSLTLASQDAALILPAAAGASPAVQIPALARAPASPDIRLNGGARPTHAQPSGEAAKQRFRADCRRALNEFLSGSERLVLPTSAEPRVSIVMVVHNQAELTYECLRTLPGALDVPSELIVVDNGSTDETEKLFGFVSGARIIRSSENLHFLRGVNRGTEECKGDTILLLNNDTTIKPGSLAAALNRLDDESDIGAVGGKIVLIDGTLQEAGSIIWSDGSCLGYGRGRLPREPEFSFSRDVDYCSGAFLLVRRSLFEKLGRLDATFAPAYYEETDLCMRIRDAGYRVVYDPSVEVKHFEFGSSSSPAKAIELQTRNRKIFVDRHRATLQAAHLPSGSRPLDARMKPLKQKRLLILDDRLPNPQLGQGFPRAHSISRLLLKQGWFLTFYPTSFPGIDWGEAYRLYPREVEVASDSGRAGLKAFLTKRAGYYDAILVSRPHNMELVNALIAQDPKILGRTKIIYDAEALIAPRDAMKRAMLGRPVPANDQLRAIENEVKLGKSACAILAVNETEAEHFRSAVRCPVSVIGHAIKIEPTAQGFAERAGLLFVGALDGDDTPNVDSLAWFVKEIMPKIDRMIGATWTLHVAGSNRSAKARSLAGPRVKLLGMVDDLSDVYANARVFVAPTRYAAGIPMKVHEAAAAGVPSVVTPLLAKQLNWVQGKDLIVGATADEFADGCAKLYTDQGLWERVREAALVSVRTDCDYAAMEKKLADVMSVVDVTR